MDVALLFAMVIGMLIIGVPIAVSLGLSSIFFLMIFLLKGRGFRFKQ